MQQKIFVISLALLLFSVNHLFAQSRKTNESFEIPFFKKQDESQIRQKAKDKERKNQTKMAKSSARVATAKARLAKRKSRIAKQQAKAAKAQAKVARKEVRLLRSERRVEKKEMKSEKQKASIRQESRKASEYETRKHNNDKKELETESPKPRSKNRIKASDYLFKKNPKQQQPQ